MLVPSMTNLEIYAEILADSPSVFKIFTTKMHYETLRMKRTNNFKWVETLHIKSARKNDWSIVINIQNGVSEINYYIKAYNKKGLVAYSVIMIEEIPLVIQFNTHFLTRYNERMQLQLTKPDQILKLFFKKNVCITPACSEMEEQKETMSVISLPEGMGLGRVMTDAPIVEMKTFIAKGMLNKNQRELINMLNEDERFYHVTAMSSGKG